MMELKDLEGAHVLTGVDEESGEIVSQYGADSTYVGNTIRFCLDGTIYVVREDDDDGYRSSMRDITVGTTPMVNTFPPVQVIGVYRDHRGSGYCDILELIDVVTGKLVLEVGTENTDDYYPSFVASFNPKGMVINAERGEVNK